MAQAQYPSAVTAKYDVSSSLKPTNTIFPVRYGSMEINLSTVSIEKIDSFVKKYPDQPYFKLKGSPSKAAASGEGK